MHWTINHWTWSKKRRMWALWYHMIWRNQQNAYLRILKRTGCWGHQLFDCFQVCQYHVELIQVNCTSSSWSRWLGILTTSRIENYRSVFREGSLVCSYDTRIKRLAVCWKIGKVKLVDIERKTCLSWPNWSIQGCSSCLLYRLKIYLNLKAAVTVTLRKKRCRFDLRLYFFSERVANLCKNFELSVTASSMNSFKNNHLRLKWHSMGLFMDNLVRLP